MTRPAPVRERLLAALSVVMAAVYVLLAVAYAAAGSVLLAVVNAAAAVVWAIAAATAVHARLVRDGADLRDTPTHRRDTP